MSSAFDGSRMVKVAIVGPVGFLFLASCSNEIETSQRQYDIVKNSGTAAEICRQGDRLVEAYLRANREADYNREKVFAAIECQSAESEERDGMPDGTKHKVEPDDLESLTDTAANAV